MTPIILGKGIFSANSEAKRRIAFAQWGVGLNKAYRAGVRLRLAPIAALPLTPEPIKKWR